MCLKFLKGCPPQILLGPFLNALTHMLVEGRYLPSKCPEPGLGRFNFIVLDFSGSQFYLRTRSDMQIRVCKATLFVPHYLNRTCGPNF